MNLCIDADQLRKALKEIEVAESRGFMHCLAVFRIASAGSMLSDVRAEYTDLWERAHPTVGSLDWGRSGQLRSRYKVVDGQLVPLDLGEIK